MTDLEDLMKNFQKQIDSFDVNSIESLTSDAKKVMEDSKDMPQRIKKIESDVVEIKELLYKLLNK